MHYAGPHFAVFLMRDPLTGETGKRTKDGTSDPDRVLALGRRVAFHFHAVRGQVGEFLLQSVGHTYGK